MLLPNADPDMTIDFEWACAWTGLLDPAIAPRLASVAAPMVHAQAGDARIVKAMRGMDGFESALTVKGADDWDAPKWILLNAISQWFRRHKLAEAAKRPGWLLRLSAVDDRRTCAGAKREHGHCYGQGAQPALPLPGCDAAHCRCSYMIIVGPIAARDCVNL